MDRVTLLVLRREIEADCAIASEAAALAESRLAERQPRDLEATAFQLMRCYNAIEQAGLRLAKAFENEIDDEAGWHVELMRRLTMDIPGIRPAVLLEGDLIHLRELRGFRHVVVHAYDLVIDGSRLEQLVGHAKGAIGLLPGRFSVFFDTVVSLLKEEE